MFLQEYLTLLVLILSIHCQNGSSSGADPDRHPPSVAVAVVSDTCKTYQVGANEAYYNSVQSGTTYLLNYAIDLTKFRNPRNINVRVDASVGLKATSSCPVIFAVGQLQYLTSMELPFSFRGNNGTLYREAARTLCLPPDAGLNLRNITVRISTCSSEAVNFFVRLSISEDYLLPRDKSIYFEVMPTAPVVHAFLFANDDDSSIKLIAESRDTKCMTVSVQPFSCPIYYYDNNVRYNGLWQTMTGKAAMTIENSGRFKTGFTVVLVAHDDDKRCLKATDSLQQFSSYNSKLLENTKPKRVTIRLSSDSRIPPSELFFVIVIPVFMCFALIIFTIMLFRWRHNWIAKEALKIDVTDSYALRNVDRDSAPRVGEEDTVERFLSTVDRSSGGYRSFSPGLNPSSRPASTIIESRRPLRNFESPGESEDVRIRQRQKSKFSFRADVNIGEFSVGKPPVLHDRHAKKFCWALITVAIFYTIPVYQLLFHYLRVLYRTGEYDTCYYNYLCAYRVGYLLDFNHFFSNVGYIIFGLAFIFIVRRREVNLICPKHNQRYSRNLSRPVSTLQLQQQRDEDVSSCRFCFPSTEVQESYGILPYYGVFYSLGLALIMEGFLSAAYHVCPNQTSFQFDTCFMYVISLLTILKVYQFRHPIFLDAHQTFGILAGLILISVAGLILEYGDSDSTTFRIFWIIFIVCQFSALIIASIYYYTLGYIMDDDGSVLTSWKVVKRIKYLRHCSFRFDRLLFPLLSLLLCIGVVGYSIKENLPFATYLLYTFIANVLGSCIYYILIMKPLHGEFKNYTWVQPTLYFVGCGIIGGFAVSYFVQSPAMWEKSAAQSRSENNMACLNAWFPFQPFYDVHDVWHFYSAAALFLAFMGLLTVDDDLVATPRNRIPVF